MYKISDYYEHKTVGTFPDYTAVMAWIGKRAQEWNYGIYRTWPSGSGTCYDVGPKVFYVEEVRDLD